MALRKHAEQLLAKLTMLYLLSRGLIRRMWADSGVEPRPATLAPHKDFELYCAMRQIGDKICRIATKHGRTFQWQGLLNPSWRQTDRGLFIQRRYGIPNVLWTPWGEYLLFSSLDGSGWEEVWKEVATLLGAGDPQPDMEMGSLSEPVYAITRFESRPLPSPVFVQRSREGRKSTQDLTADWSKLTTEFLLYDFRLFCTVQRIGERIRAMAAKHRLHCTWLGSLHPLMHQTDSGLFIERIRGVPTILWTPWGQYIMFYSADLNWDEAWKELAELLGTTPYTPREREPGETRFIRQRSVEFSCLGSLSSVNKCEDQTVPMSIHYRRWRGEMSSADEVEAAWSKLTARYKQ